MTVTTSSVGLLTFDVPDASGVNNESAPGRRWA